MSDARGSRPVVTKRGPRARSRRVSGSSSVAPRIIYGVRPVLEALERGGIERILSCREPTGRTRRLLELARQRNVPIEWVTRGEIERRTESSGHQGVMAILEAEARLGVDPFPGAEATSGLEGPALGLADAGAMGVDALVRHAEASGRPPLVVLLDGVQDPHNLGAIIRSAFALGAHGVVLPQDRSARVTPAVVRVSAGAALRLPIVTVTNLKHALRRLRDLGVVSLAARMDGPKAHEVDLSGPLALVLGGEEKGVRRTIGEACDGVVSVPMAAFDSLNVSVAAGILLYEAVRQRTWRPNA